MPKKYQAFDDVASKEIDGVLVLLKKGDEFIFELNDTSDYIWRLLQKPQTLEELVKAVSQHFSKTDKDEIAEDTQQLLSQLTEAELVRTLE